MKKVIYLMTGYVIVLKLTIYSVSINFKVELIMKFKKYILTGTLALLLSSTGITTIEEQADASSLDNI